MARTVRSRGPRADDAISRVISYVVPGIPAELTPRSVVLFPERPADGRWGAGSRLVWRGLPAAGYGRVVASDLRYDDAQTLRCQSLLSD